MVEMQLKTWWDQYETRSEHLRRMLALGIDTADSAAKRLWQQRTVITL